MIQIRNVPDPLHRELKARAAQAGQTLSDFLLGELRRLAARPTMDELARRIAARSEATPRPSAARAVRRERKERR